MTSSAALMKAISEELQKEKAENIVVDPVMVATSGSVLMDPEALKTLKDELLTVADVITPNIPEAEALTGKNTVSKEDMEEAVVQLQQELGTCVLLKGGHLIENANDLLYDGKELPWFHGQKIDNPNTHGTGCTLSSVIAANLAKGYELKESIQRSKDYLSKALADGLDLGTGAGPMNHVFVGYEDFRN